MAPLNPPEAVSSVQLAHAFHELKMVIALRQKKLAHLYDEFVKHERDPNVPPTLINQMTRTLEDKYHSRRHTLHAYEQTIKALERSLALLSNQAIELEDTAGRGTIKRLSVLLTMAQGGQVS